MNGNGRASSRIDAHQHFWHPARGDYGWLTADLPICRPYGPADLAPQLRECNVNGTVLVQAAPTPQETDYLLGIADATPFVRGVVGWIDFEDPAQLRRLERLAAHPKFVGVRPMIQDLPETAGCCATTSPGHSRPSGSLISSSTRWCFRAISRPWRTCSRAIRI